MAVSLDSGGQPKLPVEPLIVEIGQNKPLHFNVEMAVQPETRNAGLMFRTAVPPGTGMLFDFQREQQGIAFWMKNTIVSLDIIFIDGKGRIVRIAPNTTPLSETPVAAGAPTRAVLELAAGESARLGINPGDRVRSSIFGDKLP